MNIENYEPDESIEEFDPEQENFDGPNDQLESGQEEDQTNDFDITEVQELEDGEDGELAAFDESNADDDAEEITEIDEVEDDVMNDDFDNEGNDYLN
jgi:hypothetical protein